MTVKELFQQVDFKKIAKELAEDDYFLNIDNTKTEEEKTKLKERLSLYIYEKFLDMMKNTDPISSGHIVVCTWHCNLSYPENSYYDTFFINQSDLKKEIHVVDFDSNEVENYTMEEYEAKFIQNYAYEFSPWTEVLGYVVPETLLLSYGPETVAKVIYHEMTFFGFDKDETEKRVNEERDILEERIKNVEENQENLKSIDLDDFREKLGLEKETKAEKAAAHQRMINEMKINQIEYIEIMERILDEFRPEI